MNKKGLIFLIYTKIKKKGKLDRCQCKRRLKIVLKRNIKRRKEVKKKEKSKDISQCRKKGASKDYEIDVIL